MMNIFLNFFALTLKCSLIRSLFYLLSEVHYNSVFFIEFCFRLQTYTMLFEYILVFLDLGFDDEKFLMQIVPGNNNPSHKYDKNDEVQLLDIVDQVSLI